MTLLVGSIFHVTRKIVSEMTYNVSMGTLNPTIPILCSRCHTAAPAFEATLSFRVDQKLQLFIFITFLSLSPCFFEVVDVYASK